MPDSIPNELDREATLKIRTGDLAAKVIDGEAIIINMKNGIYYSADGVGAALWEGFSSGRTVGDLARSIAAHFDLPPEKAESDVTAFAHRLLEEELATTSDGGEASSDADSLMISGMPSYERPTLIRYDDMAHYFALDPPLPSLDDSGEKST